MFRACVEEWKAELLKKIDYVAEVRLLEKYKSWVFWDPDKKVNFTVHEDNLDGI